MSEFHAIIPAGGAGARLWPLSRRRAPKFLADLTGSGATLIQQTVRRLDPLTGGNVVVVTGQAHAPAVAEQLPKLPDSQILAEPSPRDSMAAIGLAAAVILNRHGDVVIGSFAADHLIKDEDAFRAAVSEAIEAANMGLVVTIGITPDHPATGFGYIHAGDLLGNLPTARSVTEFLEKPDLDTATSYLATGEYRWNAGMFVARASVLLGALAKYEPELHDEIIRLAGAWDTPGREEATAEIWPSLKKIAIDHAIAEPLAADGGVAVVPVEMGWSDVGDFASLRDVLEDRLQVSPGGQPQETVLVDAPGALVYSHSKPIAVVGIDDAVVVETEDAILVTTRQRAQDVKRVVDSLAERNLESLQ